MLGGSVLSVSDRGGAGRRSSRRLTSAFETQRALMRPANPSFEPPTDVYETEQEVIVRLEIAGVDATQVNLVISDRGRVLSVSGIRGDPAAGQRRKYYHMEIECGAFARRIRLPVPVDNNKAVARYEEGFLVITIPKISPSNSESRPVPVE